MKLLTKSDLRLATFNDATLQRIATKKARQSARVRERAIKTKKLNLSLIHI